MSLGRFNYKRKYCDLCRNLSPSQNIGYTYTYRRDARNKFIINLRRRAEVNSRRATVTARATLAALVRHDQLHHGAPARAAQSARQRHLPDHARGLRAHRGTTAGDLRGPLVKHDHNTSRRLFEEQKRQQCNTCRHASHSGNWLQDQYQDLCEYQ